jgi:bifunctional ADP-heptose synthase (sugar kinase/adenylyltransferase)
LYDEQNIETEQTLGDMIKIVDPDYWVKGSDYKSSDIIAKHPYIRNVHIVDLVENKSTTLLISEILSSNK